MGEHRDRSRSFSQGCSVKRIIAWEHERVGKWIQANAAGFYRPGAKCIGLEKDGELIAGVLYDYCNGASVYAHIAVKGLMTREFLSVIFDYPFRQLNCKVIIGLVPESNKKARRFDEHLGFKLTATIPEGHPDGKLLIYTMRKEDCRWLRSEHVEAKRARAA